MDFPWNVFLYDRVTKCYITKKIRMLKVLEVLVAFSLLLFHPL